LDFFELELLEEPELLALLLELLKVASESDLYVSGSAELP
tara:strand:- start:892 stop:1011 length:120 start_codon:yes stop_codon:yes gene_type:complete